MSQRQRSAPDALIRLPGAEPYPLRMVNYRMIVAFAYRMQRAYIKSLGTHAQYDQVDAATVDQSKE